MTSVDEYRAIYKCRLCGEKYESGVAITSQQRIIGTVVLLNRKDTSYISHGDAIGVTRTGVHFCKDRGVGLSDFCGFRTERGD